MPKVPNEISAVQMIGTTLYLILFPFLILALSGWPEGWIWSMGYVILCVVCVVHLCRKDPALLAERFKKPNKSNQKKWDELILSGLFVSFLCWVVLMPLDAKRYGWSGHFPLWIKVLSGVGLMKGAFLIYRAFADNPFASRFVEIQKERKQKVVTTGIYGYVRHPLYLGLVSLFLWSPLLLGSFYGFLLGVWMSFLLTVRTIGEEKMLAKELKGYTAYQKKVHYRLIPGVW
jgi:protein-S-isoprenylcysteine O-methyltransferase Ste14